MIATPQNTVFQGREGTGVAQVFGRAGNPMDAFRERQNQVERRQAILAEQARVQKEKRDKSLLQAIDVNPGKTFEPFQAQKRDAANAHISMVTDYFNKGGTDNPQFQAWNKKQWGQISDIVDKGNFIEKKLQGLQDAIKENPYLSKNKETIMKKAFDLYLNEDGTAKPFDQINPQAIEDLAYSPEHYDVDKMVGDWVKNLEPNTASWVDRRNTAFGLETDKYATVYKNGMFTNAPVDANGKAKTRTGLVEDEYGNPVVNITPEMRSALINESPDRLAAIEYQAKQAKMTPQDYIDSKIKEKLKAIGGGYKAQETEFGQKFYPRASSNDVDADTGIKKKDLQVADFRMQNIGHLMNAFWNPDGSRREMPTAQSQEALAYIKQNTKFGNGQVIDATIVPGTNEPGTGTVLGMPVPNNASDRVVFKVSYPGQKGKVKYESISLDDQSGASFNALWNTATTEGKRQFGYDQLRMRNQALGNSLFQPRIDREFNNKRSAEAEQKQVESWKSYKDLDSMVGRQLEGKTIKAVVPIEGSLSSIGNKVMQASGYGKVFSGKSGFTIKFEDGTTQDINPDDKDLYKKLASIYQSSSQSTDQPQEQSGSIDYSKLKY